MKKFPRDIRKKFDSNQSQINGTFKAQLKKKLFQEEFMAKKATKQPKTSFLKRVNPGPAIAVLIMVIFVGASSAAVTTSRSNNAREAEIEIPRDLAALLSFDDIRTVALTEVPTGTVVGVELEQEDGVLIYKVKFSDGSFRLYDANTGVLVNKDQLEVEESVPAGFVAGISLQEARTTAQNERPGKTITKIELEVENGVVVYSVRFSDDGRVDVDANSGAVVRVKDGEDSTSDESEEDSDDSNDDSEDSNDDSDDSEEDSEEDNSGSGSSNSGSSDDDSEDDSSSSN
jgi:uncharacterized membrane protein YkoI